MHFYGAEHTHEESVLVQREYEGNEVQRNIRLMIVFSISHSSRTNGASHILAANGIVPKQPHFIQVNECM